MKSKINISTTAIILAFFLLILAISASAEADRSNATLGDNKNSGAVLHAITAFVSGASPTDRSLTVNITQQPLNISASMTTVKPLKPTNVTFMVTDDGIPISGAVVKLSGNAIGSGITDAAGNVTINVNATGVGAIAVTASKAGYANGTINLLAAMTDVFLYITASRTNITTGLNTIVIFTATDYIKPIVNATVTLSGSAAGIATTNETGQATMSINATSNATVTAIISAILSNETQTYGITLVAKGDVNGDGTVNIVDALFIALYTVDTRTINTTVGDVNGDGQVTIVDALMIAQYTVGSRADPTTP